MIRASTVPSLKVKTSTDVPSGIFPNGCVVTVVLASVRVAHKPKHNKPVPISLNIFTNLRDPAERINQASNRLPCIRTLSHSHNAVNLHHGTLSITPRSLDPSPVYPTQPVLWPERAHSINGSGAQQSR